MKTLLLFFLNGLFLLLSTSCGVKGKPQPPLTDPVLGRGEPNFSKATEKVKLRKTAPPLPADWKEEDEDFPEDTAQ